MSSPSFQDRLHQISAQHTAPALQQKNAYAQRLKQERLERLWMLMMIPALVLCAGLGAACVSIARYARFMHSGAETDYGHFVFDLGLASLLAALIIGILQIRETSYVAAFAIGLGTMMTAMHNLVWAYQAFFAVIFSRAYVVNVMDVTESGTLWLWVLSVPLYGG